MEDIPHDIRLKSGIKSGKVLKTKSVHALRVEEESGQLK
jgi:hypothetical protein